MKTHKKLIRIFFAALIVLSTVSGALLVRPSVVSAEEAVTPRDRASVWLASNAMSYCLKTGVTGKDNGIKTSDIKSGAFIRGTTDEISTGYIVDSDGKVDCNNASDIKNIADILGIDLVDLMEGAGIYEADPQSTDRHILTDNNASDNARASKFVEFIKKETGVDPSANLADSSKYIALKFSWDKECKIRQYDSAEDESRASGVIVVNDLGEKSTEYWTFRQEKVRTVPLYEGITRKINEIQSPNGFYNCEDILVGMNTYSGSYEARMKQLVADGVDTSSEASLYNTTTSLASAEDGSSEVTCEEAADSQLAWVMCPILGAIEDTVNAIFDFVDSLLNIDATKLYDDPELRAAWGFFRVIATALLIVIGLVMIFSQAIGGDN